MHVELHLAHARRHGHCYYCGRLGGTREGVGKLCVGSRNMGAVSRGGRSPPPGSPPALNQAHDHPHSFLIGEDGLVYEGRGWDTEGAHTGSTWNPMSIGISFMGNYMGK